MSAPAYTLIDLFLCRVAETPDRLALTYQGHDGIRELTWREIARDAERAVQGLLASGVRPGDRVAQLSENRYEWILADLAIVLAGAVHVPIHAPLAAEQVAYQVHHSDARLLFVSGSQQQVKVEAAAEHLPQDLQIVSFDANADTLARRPLVDFHEWMQVEPLAPAREAIATARQKTEAESLATILYTSGTTGQPKGVMLTHRNLLSNATRCVEMFEMLAQDVRLCFLPLSHIFARTCDLYTWYASGSQLCLATSRDSVLTDCHWARPTALNGVPYFYDRVYRHLCEEGREQEPGSLRDVLGGRIKMCGSGGAALPEHLYDWFQQQEVLMLQGYGLTESSPVITISSPSAHRRGSSGKALSDVEVKIAADGEILSRGPHIMQGYWKDPEATDQVVQDGWLQTGDLGYLDEDGFLYITGRKKELIVTSAGKNIAPVLLESLLTEDPLIDQALVIGDGRNYLTALIVPNWEAVRREIPQLDDSTAVGELCQHADVRTVLHRQIDWRLSRVSYHEQVRKFTILARPFSLEQHEMTPKMSLRRQIIHDHFAEEIEAMYRR